MYQVITTKGFRKKLEKIVKKDREIPAIVAKVARELGADPFQPSLKTHKVDAKFYKNVYATRVTGDVRLIWTFEKGKLVILLLDIGGHSGAGNVYR